MGGCRAELGFYGWKFSWVDGCFDLYCIEASILQPWKEITNAWIVEKAEKVT